MNLIQRLVERVRPILNLKAWDYCVIWKLDDDQRFLEWMDCCCVGSAESIENGGEDLLFSVASAPSSCRDVMFQHPRTKSCDLLANLPSSMPLDSGIYTEALMSNQARWLNCSGIIPEALQETAGTRVLIPLPIGLAELFVDKQVPEDQQIIDFVTSQFNMLLIEQQSMINSSNMDNLADENDIHDKDLNNLNPFEPPIPPASTPESLSLPYDISVDRIRLCNNSSMSFLEQFNYSAVKNGSCFEGSNDLFQSNGFQDMDALQKSLMSRPGKRHADAMEPLSKEEQGNDRDTFRQETARSESMSDCDLNEQEDDDQCRRTGKGPQAKNLAAERRRRKKLNERIYSLRSLVPKITKLDRASVLSDAIDFVMELQQQVKDLQHELEQSEHDEGATNTGTSYNQNNDRSEILNQNGIHFGSRDENDNEKGLNGFHVGSATEASKQNMESKQMNTFTIEQATFMDRHMGSFVVPAGSFSVFLFLTILLFTSLNERVFVPLARKITHSAQGISSLQRVGMGLILSVIGMVAAATVEKRRRDVAVERKTQISAFWLIPQFFLVGAGEAFAYVGQLEFFIREAPERMKSMSTGFFLSTLSMGYFVSSLLVSLVDRVTNGSWLRSNLNRAKLNYFYLTLAVLSLLNFFAFLTFATRHQYKVQQYQYGPSDREKQLQDWNNDKVEDTENNH